MFTLIRRTGLFLFAITVIVSAAATIAGRAAPGDVIAARATPTTFLIFENTLLITDVPRRVHLLVRLPEPILPDNDVAVRLSPQGFSADSRHQVLLTGNPGGSLSEDTYYTFDLRTRDLRLADDGAILPVPENTVFVATDRTPGRISGIVVDGPDARYHAVWNDAAIQVIDTAAETVVREVREITGIRYVEWSPRGDYLLVVAADLIRATIAVYTVAVDDGAVFQSGVSDRMDFRLNVRAANWSPDGRYLMIYGARAGAGERGVIFIVTPDGESVRLLSDWVNASAHWLPEENATLIYSRGQPGTIKQIARYDAATRDETHLRNSRVELLALVPGDERVMLVENVPGSPRRPSERRLSLMTRTGDIIARLYQGPYDLFDLRYYAAP